MSTPNPISPSGFSFENSISVEPTESGYGTARSFTLADSFYDAHANDVFLPRKEQPISVESTDASISKERFSFDPTSLEGAQDEEKDHASDVASLWPSDADPLPPRPTYIVQPPAVSTDETIVKTQTQALQKVSRRHISPAARMEDSFRIPPIATIVFVITMIAIFYLGSQVAGYYAPVVQGDTVEFVGRPN